MPDSLLPDPTRTAAPPAGSTTRNGEQLTAERTPGSTLSVPPEHLPRPFGRYELRQLLGRGGMGSVYLAHDAQLDRLVALKMPRPFGDTPALWRERFLTEARAAATLSHPNICPVHDVGEHDGQPYLTMAYIDGETLAARLKRDGRLAVGEAVGLVAVVARAMAEAHARGIVHRDLKPGNLLLDRRGRPVVTDFGLALRASTADDLRLTLTGVAMGTPAYMPPEQAGGDADAVGPASDVYALGVILFELLTGRVPFRGRTFGQLLAQIERDPPPLPSSLADDIPPALDAVVLTALAKAPADRFPSAAEFADALEQFQAGHHAELTSRYGAALAAAGETAPHPRPAPTPPRKRTRWWPAVAAGFLGLLVLLGGTIYVTTDKGELKVEFLDPDTGKPIAAPKGIDVKINGQRVVLDPDGKPITVRAGDDQMLVVTGEDFVTESQTFTLKRWKDATVRVSLIPKERLAKRPDEKPKADGPKVEVKPKPRPVEFPKDKTLIEAGGWQILADATKEQMQAWLDERKTAKHSVMWLDTYPVAGKPVYSAVAALDGREGKWEAMLAVSLAEMPPPVMRKRLSTEDHFVRSLSGYPDSDKLLTCLLWHSGAKRWTYRPCDSGSELAQTDLAGVAKQFNMGAVVVRPMPTEGGGVVWGYYGEMRVGGLPRHKLNVTAAELPAYLDTQRKDGYRPVALAAAAGTDGPVFGVVTDKAKDKSDWHAEWDLPADNLAEAANERVKLGFRPDTVTAYAWDGAVRYCVVWVKDPPKPVPYPKDKVLVKQDGYETLLDATKGQMEAWLDEKKKAGHSVLWLDAYPVGDRPVYSAVAALDGRQKGWVAMLDLPVTAARNLPAMRKQISTEANTVTSMGGFARDGDLRICLLWRPESVSWAFAIGQTLPSSLTNFRDTIKTGAAARHLRPYPSNDKVFVNGFLEASAEETPYSHALTAEELQTFLAAQRQAGAIPTAVSGYAADGVQKFAVVCRPNKNKVEWEFATAKSAADVSEQAAARSKLGFRPASVTAHAWDGAVRYCVLWIKDPPKPTQYPNGPAVIKQDGWAMIVDATKEQAEAWLDERKKARHSVMWLDAAAVDGKPVYSAVAALDDRQLGWQAFLDELATRHDQASNELLAAVKTNSFVSLSGHVTDGKPRTAILLHPGPPNAVAIPNLVRNELAKLAVDVGRNGNGYRAFRPYPGFREGTLFAVVTEPMSAAGEKAFDLTADGLTKFAADTRAAGHRLGAVTAYPADGGLKFAAVSATNPGKGEWDHGTGLTATQLIAKTADRSKLGFRPLSVTGYAWDGAVRYCLVWVKDPPKKPDAKKDEPKK